jgi:hypothetical protein
LAFGVLTEICPRRQNIPLAMDLSFRGGGVMNSANQKHRVRDVFGLIGAFGVIAGVVLTIRPGPVGTFFDMRDAKPYFEDLAKRDARHVSEMKDRSSKGTPAAKWADFQYYYSKAAKESGDADPQQSVSTKCDKFIFCSEIALCKPNAQTDGGGCNSYSNFHLEERHLVSFDVNGNTIADRVFVSGTLTKTESQKALGAELSVLAAYEGAVQLYIAIQISAKEQPVIVEWENSKYNDPSNGPTDPTSVFVGHEGQIPQGRTYHFIVAYGHANLGGSLVVPIAAASGREAPTEVTLSVGGAS